MGLLLQKSSSSYIRCNSASANATTLRNCLLPSLGNFSLQQENLRKRATKITLRKF